MSKPTLRDRTRPAELLMLAAALAIFAGLIVLMSTRDFLVSIVFLGASFIVSLVVLAMLALAASPSGAEASDLAEQDRLAHDPTADPTSWSSGDRGH